MLICDSLCIVELNSSQKKADSLAKELKKLMRDTQAATASYELQLQEKIQECNVCLFMKFLIFYVIIHKIMFVIFML